MAKHPTKMNLPNTIEEIDNTPMGLSIITVTKNNLIGLQKTIDTVLPQSFKDYELIVVDGASDDRTPEYLSSLNDEFKNIGVPFRFVSEPDTGIYNAMNKGIAMAQEKYLLFLNAGDYLASADTLKNLFSLNPDVDVVSGRVIFDASEFQPESVCNSPQEVSLNYFAHANLPHQGTIYKRTLFEIVGGYDETLKIMADAVFNMYALLYHNASYSHIDLVIAHCETAGISNDPKNIALMQKEVVEGLSKVMPRFVEGYKTITEYCREQSDSQIQYFKSFRNSLLFRVIWKCHKVNTKH